MLLRKHSNVLYAPGDSRSLIIGTALAAIRKVMREPQYNKGAAVAAGWSTQADGRSVSVTDFNQLSDGSTISFCDTSRMLQELASPDVLQVRPASMPKLVHVPGSFIASTSPMALDVAEEQVEMGTVLREAGFQVIENDFFKLPAYVYRFRSTTIKALFGDDADGLFPFCRLFKRHGAGELVLQSLQFDSEKRFLLAISDLVGAKVESGGDEIGTLLDALQVSSLTELSTLISMVGAMNSIRFAKLSDGSRDTTGLGFMLYYSMIDSSFLNNLPDDVLLAFASCDSSGITRITKVAGQAVPELTITIRDEDKIHIPTLRSITSAHLSALARARVLYKLMLVYRFMEAKGYPLALSTTLKDVDRLSFFELMV